MCPQDLTKDICVGCVFSVKICIKIHYFWQRSKGNLKFESFYLYFLIVHNVCLNSDHLYTRAYWNLLLISSRILNLQGTYHQNASPRLLLWKTFPYTARYKFPALSYRYNVTYSITTAKCYLAGVECRKLIVNHIASYHGLYLKKNEKHCHGILRSVITLRMTFPY